MFTHIKIQAIESMTFSNFTNELAINYHKYQIHKRDLNRALGSPVVEVFEPTQDQIKDFSNTILRPVIDFVKDNPSASYKDILDHLKTS